VVPVAKIPGHQMVDLDREAAAPGLVHQGRRLLDRLGPVQLRPLGPGGPPGDLEGRAGRAQLHRDAPPRAPRGPGHQGHPSGQ
jgi:hypothetical protein